MDTPFTPEESALFYRAIQSRDARFDGRFFSGVTTTGIYCRPICPARTPLAAHVRYFSCAAAAEAAGFRACRRCHPEVSPGSPQWNTRADRVGRALRLIAAGVVDAESVAGLARRLDVSARHLHRELVTEVGAGPLALARTRRAQTARQLIDQSDLSLTEIAFASGFSSIRQFNQTLLAAFGCAPSAFRRRTPLRSTGEGLLTLRLAYRPPFDAHTLLGYLAHRALPGVEEVRDGIYRRTVRLPHSRGVIELEPLVGAHAVALRMRLDSLRDLAPLVARCRALFDLDAAPAAIGDVLAGDRLLGSLVAARPGLRVPGAVDGFELAVRAILGQQVSVVGARTLAGRLVAAIGEPLGAPESALSHYFPTPQALATASMDGLGLTQGRINALRGLARAVADGGLDLSRDADWAETVSDLLRIPGIGPWTASYIAMRALGDPDAFPAADLALRHAFERHDLPGDPRAVEHHAEAWRPWRAYAAHHLWASLPSSPEALPIRQRERALGAAIATVSK